MIKNRIVWIAISCIAMTFFIACQKEIFIASGEGLSDWSSTTHASSANPDYDIVFNQSKVNRLDIVVSSNEYDIMQTNLAKILSDVSGGPGQGGPGQGGVVFSEETPVYVPADVYFNGNQWYEVGVRYKGNSSLTSSYQQGIGKLPLRLKFDYFEDLTPEITGQTFYGFSDLSLSSNYKDLSFLREKMGADLFREFGVPAARTAFYEIYFDDGSGPEYMGLYSMVEVVFDTMLENFFGTNSGNCYKPDGDGATFSTGLFTIDDFEKKTNEGTSDWSDIEEFNAALRLDRTSDVEAWKANIESMFDVDGFLKYLAVNNTIQNWDTYGNMTHNYFLYHDPADDLLKWIVWDHNEAFQSAGMNGPLSFSMDEVGYDWPLISYFIEIDEYKEIYEAYIEEFVETVFLPSKIVDQYSSQVAIISDAATTELPGFTFLSSANDFANAVNTIKAHCSTRVQAALEYLQ